MHKTTMVMTAVGAAVLAGCALMRGGERRISMDEFLDRMAGAWIGQSAGVAFGAPTEFRYNNRIIPDKEMPKWRKGLINNTFQQDDLYVEMTFIDTLDRRGVDVSCREAGIDFANSTYRLWCANHNGRNNLRNGIPAPASSHPKFHPTTDDIDYQIEADFSGILAPGLPQAAVDLGETFGRIMNYGDGLYAGQFVGALYATAYFEQDRVKVVEEALEAIPAESRYAEMARDLLAWYLADPKDWQGAWKKANDKYHSKEAVGKTSSWELDVKLNGAMVLLGYLFGEGDMDRTMYISTAGGYDSDCNPSSACGVLGVQLGAKGLAKYLDGFDYAKKWENTDYDYAKLLETCEKLVRKLVVKYGGRVETDGDGVEWLVVPASAPVPSKFVRSCDPEPFTGCDKLTDAERKQIPYAPCWFAGGPSEKPAPCVMSYQQLAFLGDSITEFGNRPVGYVNLVMKGLELLGRQGVGKIPAGISGNKSNQMLARLDRDVLAKKPHWMTLSCGVNDVWHGKGGVPLDQYKANIAKILDACAAANVNVIVLTPTLIGEDEKNENNQKLLGYVAWLKEEAARRKLPVADLNAAMRAELARIRQTDKTPGNKLTVDGVHMADAGNRMMAWGVLEAMGVDKSEKPRLEKAWIEMISADQPKPRVELAVPRLVAKPTLDGVAAFRKAAARPRPLSGVASMLTKPGKMDFAFAHDGTNLYVLVEDAQPADVKAFREAKPSKGFDWNTPLEIYIDGDQAPKGYYFFSYMYNGNRFAGFGAKELPPDRVKWSVEQKLEGEKLLGLVTIPLADLGVDPAKRNTVGAMLIGGGHTAWNAGNYHQPDRFQTLVLGK